MTMMSRRMIGKSWGLNPRISYWLYTAITRPLLTYGTVVWVSCLERKTIRKKINRNTKTGLPNDNESNCIYTDSRDGNSSQNTSTGLFSDRISNQHKHQTKKDKPLAHNTARQKARQKLTCKNTRRNSR